MKNTWIISTGNPAISNLIDISRDLGGAVTVAILGDREAADAAAVSGADSVTWIEVSQGAAVEAYADALAQVLVAAAPDAVITAGRDSERALVGAIAEKLAAPTLTMVMSASVEGDGATITRGVFGGISTETVDVTGPVILIADGGSTRPEETAAPINKLDLTPDQSVAVVANEPAKQNAANLAEAKRIVAVGRGMKSEEDLALIQQLADALGASVACSRPLSEGLGWFPHDRYVGVTGQMVAPELYVAVGISGQLQHVAGCRGAGTVVVINSDKNAPYFNECDYGVVGDLYDVVPALTAALQ